MVMEEISNEIDINELTTLEEQQDCCVLLVDELVKYEKTLRNRISCIQTINGMIQSDDKLKMDLSEFVGYYYGRLNAYLNSVSTALTNLNGFVAGDLDELEHAARRVYIGLWYNIGMSGLEAIEDSVHELEKMEIELIEMAPKDDDGLIVIKGETIH